MLLYSLSDFGFVMLKIPGVYNIDGANPAEAGLNFRHFRQFRHFRHFFSQAL